MAHENKQCIVCIVEGIDTYSWVNIRLYNLFSEHIL